MTFYSYNYLVHQNSNHTLVQLVVIGIIIFTQIMQRVAKEQHVKKTAVWSNTSSVSSGMLIKVHDHIYNVTVNTDGNSYTLTKATPIQATINYVKEGQ